MTRPAIIAAVGAATMLADQTTKTMGEGEYNPDFMLGVPGPGPAVMVAVMLATLVAVAWFISPPWAAGLIVGGSLSNIADRITYGAVRDFIPAQLILFNIADIAIAIGLVAWLSNQRKEVPT